MERKTFRFKKFSVADSQSSMKLSTDGVLLGAWVDLEGVEKALDVGTGCGIIALMIAQRSKAMVNAIDIHEGSVADALLNFQNSPWRSRLHAECIPFSQYAKKSPYKFDLIICNPPYFSASLKPSDELKMISRHDEGHLLPGLFENAGFLLSPNGKLALIIPHDRKKDIGELASKNQMYINRVTVVSSVKGNPPIRLMAEISFIKKREIVMDSISIRSDTEHFSEEYRELTKDFYLAF